MIHGTGTTAPLWGPQRGIEQGQLSQPLNVGIVLH
jgi:hypothetical protein